MMRPELQVIDQELRVKIVKLYSNSELNFDETIKSVEGLLTAARQAQYATRLVRIQNEKDKLDKSQA